MNLLGSKVTVMDSFVPFIIWQGTAQQSLTDTSTIFIPVDPQSIHGV